MQILFDMWHQYIYIYIITGNRFKIVFIQGNLCKTKCPLIQSSDYTGFCLFKVQFRQVKPVLRGYLWDKEKVMGQENVTFK